MEIHFARIFIIFFLSVFFSIPSVLAQDYTHMGGPARRAALGGQEITLPDTSSRLDLFEEGFAAALVLRAKKNSLSTYWGAMPHGQQIEMPLLNNSLRDHPLYLTAENDASAGLTWFIDGENAVRFIPYIKLNEGESDLTSGVYSDYEYRDTLENLAAADVIFSRKITDKFYGGASLRAAFYRDETRIVGYEYSEFEGYYYEVINSITDKIFYSKAEYSISAAFTPDDRSCAAVSLGSLKTMSPRYEPWITGMRDEGFDGAIEAYSALFSGYSFSRDRAGAKTATLWKTTETLDEKAGVAGFDISAGCGTRGTGLSAFTASAGLTFGIEGDYSAASTTVVDMYSGDDSQWTAAGAYRRIKEGSAHHISLKGRYDFGGMAGAAEFQYYSAGAGFTEENGAGETAVTSQVFDAALGMLFLPERFAVPVEIFIKSRLQSEDGASGGRHADYSIFNTGLKTGVEYTVSEGVFMRLGFDAAYGGTSSYVKQGEEITGELVGTYSNPAFLQAALSFGAGHFSDGLEINLNLRYSNTGRLPFNPETMKGNESAMAVTTDVKLFF